eukprot:m.1878 g.1878  ORF g.1878 m.1878 type:complete len:384 (+) comp7998_c0_seq2:37-1188(+)
MEGGDDDDVIILATDESLGSPLLDLDVHPEGSTYSEHDEAVEESEKKKRERAMRFDIKMEEEGEEKEVMDAKIERGKTLIAKLSKTVGKVRQDALFLLGTDKMSTKDVLAIFDIHGPSSVEWINDSSCNVVWDNSSSATDALVSLGKNIICEVERGSEDAEMPLVTTQEEKNKDDNPTDEEPKILVEEVSDQSTASSQSDYWRLGPSHKKAAFLIIRRATTGDCKVTGASRHSRYYLLHGNPNIPGQPRGISTKRLRMIRKRRRGEGDIDKMDAETSSGVPVDECMTGVVGEHGAKRDSRLKMRADDEACGVDAWDRSEVDLDDVSVKLPEGLPRGDLRGKLRPHRDLRKVLESRREEERPVSMQIKANLEDGDSDRKVLVSN